MDLQDRLPDQDLIGELSSRDVPTDLLETDELKEMPVPNLSSFNVAVVTGAASGIGLAAARKFAASGLRVCLADLDEDRLSAAANDVAEVAPDGEEQVLAVPADVSRFDDLKRLEDTANAHFGDIDVLMNNAGIQPGSSIFSDLDDWHRIIGANLWGVINGCRAFAPRMIERARPGMIINTGSKQGITTPPGDPAYNVSKAGVKAFTEALEHELRNTSNCLVSAHLFIPGFVFTPLAARGRTEKPDAAWTPEETVDFLLGSLERGDFYILCPDNDVSRSLDEKRIAWAAGDIIENRPALSRWHPDFEAPFKSYVEGTD